MSRTGMDASLESIIETEVYSRPEIISKGSEEFFGSPVLVLGASKIHFELDWTV